MELIKLVLGRYGWDDVQCIVQGTLWGQREEETRLFVLLWISKYMYIYTHSHLFITFLNKMFSRSNSKENPEKKIFALWVMFCNLVWRNGGKHINRNKIRYFITEAKKEV